MKRESRTVDRSDQVDSRSQRYLPLVDLLVDTRAELMELAIASGLKVLETRLEEDRTVICGSGMSIKSRVRRRGLAPFQARSCSVAGRSRFVGRACGRRARRCRCRRFG